MRTLGIILSLSTILAACHSPSEPPTPAATVTPQRQWAGGLIEIQSSLFKSTGLPTVFVGTRSLEFAGISPPSGLLYRLPADTSGTLTLSGLLGDRSFPIGDVTAYGFVSSFRLAPGLVGVLEAWPRGGQASVVGATTRGLGRLYPGSGTATEYPDIHSGGIGGGCAA